MVNRYMACGHDLQSYDASSSAGMDVVVIASDYAALEAELKDVRLAVVRLKMGFDHIQAERDEWKRRLDAVVAIVGLDQQGEFEDWPAGEHIHALRDVRAIAEGRDNG